MYRRSNGMCYRLDNSRFLFPNSILFILLQSKGLIIRLSAKPNINELMLMFTNGGMLANKKNYISWKMGYTVTMRFAKKIYKN